MNNDRQIPTDNVTTDDRLRLYERRRQENIETQQAVNRLASVLGQRLEPVPAASELMSALHTIGVAQGITFQEPSADSEGDTIAIIARSSRLRYRRLRLQGEWWKSDCGPLLGCVLEDDDERPVALLPGAAGNYDIFDPRDGSRRRVTPTTKLTPEAVTFYRSLPERALSLWDLPIFAVRPYVRELVVIVALVFLVTLLGMLLPQAMRWAIDRAIPDADRRFLLELGLVLVAVNIGQAVFLLSQGLVTQRVQAGGTASLQAAAWDRLLRLAPNFFRRFASADLLNRTMLITEVSQSINGTVLRSFLTGFLSLLYLGLLFSYSVPLTFIALLVAGISATVTTLLAYGIRRQALAIMELEGRLLGFVVQVINGIAKLRVAGAEQRAYNHWASRYATQLRREANAKFLEDAGTLFTFVMPTVASIALFLVFANILHTTPAASKMLTTGGFVAFLTAFGMFLGGVTAASQAVVEVTDSLAKQRLMKPILQAQPESASGRANPGSLEGHIALDNVSFRYSPGGPLILNNVNLFAQPGEFVALVGPSGSGKSTLLRLLIGFETPTTGSVLYDRKNLAGLDLTAARRQLGIVLQSAYIAAGPLYENIAAGNLVKIDDLWQAAEEAALADDIRQLPMGMHTFIAEGGSNLSGGQRQRLLIARALVSQPKILLFDEATSALDNVTQATVTETLDRRQVTRLVIAHRLSTIQNADRIYVLESGRIVQIGSFEELANTEGLFRQMMRKQQI